MLVEEVRMEEGEYIWRIINSFLNREVVTEIADFPEGFGLHLGLNLIDEVRELLQEW